MGAGRESGQVANVGPVLVGVLAQLIIAEPEGRDGVETVAHQADPFVSRQVVGQVDSRAEPPVAILDPADDGLVAIDVGMLDPTRGQQALVHPARYDRRQPAIVGQRLGPDRGLGELEAGDVRGRAGAVEG